jgi:large subunit ribosomal protein L15
MPLYRRLPKRGFTPPARAEYTVVNLKALGRFPAGSVVEPDGLAQAGLIKKSDRGRVKILGEGTVEHALIVKVHAISAGARSKIEGQGGRVELLTGAGANQ